MEYKDYIAKKKGGRVEIVSAGGGYAIAKKRWSSETGEQIEPEIVALDVDALSQKKVELQAEILDIEKVLSDVAAL